MISFRKLLVPLDFSEPSKKALDCGLAIATRLKARLVVAHVIPEASTLQYAFPIENLAIEINQREQAVQEIRRLIPDHQAKLVGLQEIVTVGRIEDTLLRIIEQENVDLIIMGSHGRRNFSRWFLGSTTERILRKVPIPILTVSHIDETRYPFGGGLTAFKRLLYATELDEPAAGGLEYATELAQQFASELTVMTAVEYLNVAYEASVYLGSERAERLESTHRQLEKLVKEHNPHKLAVKTMVVEGRPYHQILSVAQELNIDCIVMNLQSRGTLERAFLGTTAERVVRLATMPVLSIPVAASKGHE